MTTFDIFLGGKSGVRSIAQSHQKKTFFAQNVKPKTLRLLQIVFHDHDTVFVFKKDRSMSRPLLPTTANMRGDQNIE
jgi:hypothetical protein